MKRIYIKRDRKYWYEKQTGHYPWKWFVIFMALFTLWALINAWSNRNPLISPVVLSPVKQVYAETISCETPKGYLECQAYNGKITWEQFEKISKIIKCESGWNPEAINHKNKNGTYDMGLVQINSIHKDIKPSERLDFKKSIDWMIKKINKDNGYGAWLSSINCHGVKN